MQNSLVSIKNFSTFAKFFGETSQFADLHRHSQLAPECSEIIIALKIRRPSQIPLEQGLRLAVMSFWSASSLSRLKFH